MSRVSSPQRTASLVRAGVFGGWLLFTLMVIALSWAGALARGRPNDLGGLILWNTGWLFWAGATFLVAQLTRRFPFERERLGRGLLTHTIFGIGMGVSLLGLEFLLAHALEKIWPGAPRANAFLGFIVYKFHVYFLIYWMILGATRAYDYYFKYRSTELRASQLGAELAQAQLRVLKAQLHPHFLFNTHHAIVSLMLKQENAAAIKMLTQLSDLLRLTLRHTDRQVSSLGEELEALELYLEIQRERFRDRLEVRFAIDPGARIAEVPSLLLQPLVENALQHGIDALPAGGIVCIRAAVTAGQLLLTVSDNGPGFPTDFPFGETRGIGLNNTQARLARLYGSDYRLEFRPTAPQGAEVVVTLPLRRAAPTSASTL